MLLEPNIYALWGAAQTAKGTPVVATAMSRRFVQVAGNFSTAREDGEEAYGDLPQAGNPSASKYGGRLDWINSLLGNGEPGIQATPTELAWLLWIFHGAETVTAVPGPPASQKHSFVPQVGLGKYATFMVRVGNQVVRRDKFNDCLITRIQLEGSTANKAVRVTPRILSLDPGEKFATDPTTPAGLPTEQGFRYTDGSGAFKIDGQVFRGQSQFTFVIDDAWEPVYGDDSNPHDLAQGAPTVTIGATVAFDSDALARANAIIYGTPTPAAGAKPTRKTIIGSYGFDLQQRDSAGALNGLGCKLDIPGVKWSPPEYPGPNPAGGATELAFAGSMRPVVGQAPYTISVNTPNTVTAFTA